MPKLNDKVTLPSGKLATAMVTDIIPAETIVVPRRISYPEVRRAYETGTFKLGDTVNVSITITDIDGNDKTPDDSDFQSTLDNYIEDENMEVLGIFYMDFVESSKGNQIQQGIKNILTDDTPVDKIKL